MCLVVIKNAKASFSGILLSLIWHTVMEKNKKLILIISLLAFSCGSLYSQGKKFPAPASADAIINPVKGNEASLIPGKKLYTQLCVTCHGEKGKGDGIAAPGLSVRPADHTSDFVQRQTDGALFWVISAGYKTMPPYKSALTATQRWQVINYIRTLAAGHKKTAVPRAEVKATVKEPKVTAARRKAKPKEIAPAEKPIEPAVSAVEKPAAEAPVQKGKEPEVSAEDTTTFGQASAPVNQGENNFAVFGNAEMKYFSDKNNKNFTDLNFKPIFLWKISPKLFVEAEPEFETGGGSLDIGLEYANMVYILNRYVTLHAGRFLPKFGAYRGRMGEGFINRFSTDPVGFGDGGIGAMNEVGVGAQGGFGVGSAKLNYELYISNGSQLLTDPENAGQFDYEAYAANNNAQAAGGRIGLLPFSNSSLEIAYSFQNKEKTGEKGSPYENVGVLMQAFDLNYWGHIKPIKSDIRVIAEWKHQKVDNAVYFAADSSTYTFKNTPTAYYIAGTIRPSHLENMFLRNLEIAARYSEFKRPAGAPWGGSNTHQFALSLDYWLKWNTVLKMTYQKEKDADNAFVAMLVFGF